MTNVRILEQFALSHRCWRCRDKGRLEVRWNGEHQVWCPLCGNVERFERQKSITQMWREDPDSVPVTVANRLEEKYGGRAMENRALATIDEPTMLLRLEKARWLKDVTPADRPILAALAVQYHLDPVMGELVIYEGKPYITTPGMIGMAARSPLFEGLDDRPMSTEEKQQYGYEKAPVAWIAKVYKKGFRVPAVGTGTADPANPLRGNPVEKTRPQWMARSRAIRQAMKVYFPQGLPFQSAEDAGIVVDVQTGEVLGPSFSPENPAVIDGEIVGSALVAESWPVDEGPDPGEPPTLDPLAARRADFARYLEGKSEGWIGIFRQRFYDAYKVSLDEASLETLDLAWETLHKPKAVTP